MLGRPQYSKLRKASGVSIHEPLKSYLPFFEGGDSFFLESPP